MASPACQKCISRTSLPYATSKISARPPRASICSKSFSTSAIASAADKGRNSFTKGWKTGGARDTGRSVKPPNPGERKAARKRLVLSNTNALEVPGITEVTPAELLEPNNVGKVFALPGEVVDSLRAVEAFKVTQAWSMFRKPSMLIREDSIKLAQILEEAEKRKSTQSFIIDGHRACGKSIMLLQAMAAAFMKKWVVLHIPEAKELTTACTAYAPIKDTSPAQYTQSEYTATWLEQIAKGNEILHTLKIAKEHVLPFKLAPGDTLGRLAELGARDPDGAWPAFQAFWEELTLPGRPPILMTLDGLSHACRVSDYRDPDFKLIHSFDLVLLGHFFSYLSKDKTLPNGGAVLAATTYGNTPKNAAVELAIKQKQEAKVFGQIMTHVDPFKPVATRDFEALKNVELMQLGGISKNEARGLMEYWAASGILRARVDEKTVVEKWALAGNGIVGEIEKGALRMRI